MYNVTILDPTTDSIINRECETIFDVYDLEGYFCKASTAMRLLTRFRKRVAHVENLETSESFWIYDVVI